MRKKIVKVAPFSPNVEKVFYEDGTWGLRGVGTGYSIEKVIPDQGRTGKAIPWQDSTDGEPASTDEIEDIENQMERIRKLSDEHELNRRQEDDLIEKFVLPKKKEL